MDTEQNSRPKPRGLRIVEWLVTIPSEKEDAKRNYEVWNSEKQLFVFGGRLRTVRQTPLSLITFTCALLPGILFFIFEASWANKNISVGLVVWFVYSWLLCLVSFIRASTMDPGCTPRNIHITDEPHSLPEEYHTVISLPSGSDKSVDVRHCTTCRTWRMPRSFHCSKCDQCVSIHDHHCKWLNNCVGERNHGEFFTFLLFATLSAITVCAAGYYRIFTEHHNGDYTMAQTLGHIPMTLFNVIFCHLAMLYPLLLLMFHLALISSQKTTREYLRHWNTAYDNPFTLNNFVRNIVSTLCRPRGYSYVSARGQYEGDMRFDRI